MTKISEALTYGLTIRESATDGSDWTNPAADYRRLFLGEDGALHLKDSAGAVTDIGASGSMATDALWDAAGDLAVGTGANTGGRLAAGAAGGVLAMGNSAVIWNANTSFPASKATGDRYWRTDLGMEFYWDGTRWVSAHLFTWPVSMVTTTTGGAAGFFPAVDGSDLWLVDFRWSHQVTGTHGGSNYWNCELHKYDTSGSADTTLLTLPTDKSTSGWIRSSISAIGAALGTGIDMLYINIGKISSPGALAMGCEMRYRIIAT